MNNHIDEDHQEFEAWWLVHGEWPKSIERCGDGYTWPVVSLAWRHWRAACEWNRTKVQS